MQELKSLQTNAAFTRTQGHSQRPTGSHFSGGEMDDKTLARLTEKTGRGQSSKFTTFSLTELSHERKQDFTAIDVLIITTLNNTQEYPLARFCAPTPCLQTVERTPTC